MDFAKTDRLDWDDFALVLGIADAGSLSGGARRLGRSHATLFRRLNAIEARIGARLFERSRTGYAPTPAGEEIAQAARAMAQQAAEAERRVLGRDLRPSGTVRLTTTDSLFHGLLAPALPRFRAACPEIALDIVVTNAVADLSRRDADVALRPSDRPPDYLVGRRLGVIQQAVYGRRDAAGPAADTAWIGPEEGMGYRALQAWMAAAGVERQVRVRLDTVLGMHAAACAGLGLAVLPCYLGERCRDLVRHGDPIPELAAPLWVLTHPDLRRTARIRAVTEFLGTARLLVPVRPA